MAVALLIIGALLTITGSALYDPRAGLIAAGVLCLLAGADLARPRRSDS